MGRIGLGIHIGGVRYRTLGRRRSLFSLFGHLAIGHKYRNHGYHVSRRFSDLKHSKSGRSCTAPETRRSHSGDPQCTQRNDSIEHLSDEELEGLTKHYDRLRAECEARRKREDVKA